MIVPPLYFPSVRLRSLTMTRPTIGLSLSPPVHLVQRFGFPWASFGSDSPTIFPKTLPPCSYISTVDSTLPDLSSTVFQRPTTGSAAMATPDHTIRAPPTTAQSCLIEV